MYFRALVLALLAPSIAAAHFALRAPAAWKTQDGLGSPQKLGPCGEEAGGTITGAVTAFAKGETITITLDETVYHPGHYRVALAVNNRSELPAEPLVTPGATQCGSVPIMNPPLLPVLADGLLLHTTPFTTTQSIQVTLPPDLTCDHCTLQVLEFMSNHPAPCFYHHCADISIQGDPATPCTADTECADANVCTTDHCDLSTYLCEHVDTVTATCNDGDVCTRDRCAPVEGCVAPPITLTDVVPGFLGTLPVASCASDAVPPIIGKLFQRADALVVRATPSGPKTDRFLQRAATRLQAAIRKVERIKPEGLSAACRTALSDTLTRALADVGCLLAQ